MRASFAQSLAWVRQDEGGNSDDPADSGGRTSRGITQREYDAWCQLNNLPGGDVWQAPDSTIDAIYFNQYWTPYCDPLPKGIDYVYFDMAVNMGQRQATILLQRALNVDQDGHFGIITMAAAQKANSQTLIGILSQDRIDFYKVIEQDHPQDVEFDKGWMSRVANVRQRALRM